MTGFIKDIRGMQISLSARRHSEALWRSWTTPRCRAAHSPVWLRCWSTFWWAQESFSIFAHCAGYFPNFFHHFRCSFEENNSFFGFCPFFLTNIHGSVVVICSSGVDFITVYCSSRIVLRFLSLQKSFDEKQAEEDGLIKPRPGMDQEYDDAIAAVEKVKDWFEQHRVEQSRKFKCKVRWKCSQSSSNLFPQLLFCVLSDTDYVLWFGEASVSAGNARVRVWPDAGGVWAQVAEKGFQALLERGNSRKIGRPWVNRGTEASGGQGLHTKGFWEIWSSVRAIFLQAAHHSVFFIFFEHFHCIEWGPYQYHYFWEKRFLSKWKSIAI